MEGAFGRLRRGERQELRLVGEAQLVRRGSMCRKRVVQRVAATFLHHLTLIERKSNNVHKQKLEKTTKWEKQTNSGMPQTTMSRARRECSSRSSAVASLASVTLLRQRSSQRHKATKLFSLFAVPKAKHGHDVAARIVCIDLTRSPATTKETMTKRTQKSKTKLITQSESIFVGGAHFLADTIEKLQPKSMNRVRQHTPNERTCSP